MDYNWLYIGMLFVAGIGSGFINTLAGGGSNLALPVLLMLPGIDAKIAISTNRVAILFQNLTGTLGFAKARVVRFTDFLPYSLTAVGGAIVGIITFGYVTPKVYSYVLGAVLLITLYPLLFKPGQNKKPLLQNIPWLSYLVYFVAGFYGGFIQVSIGFVLLTVLSLTTRLNLVQSNAVKLFITLLYSLPVVAWLAFFTDSINWRFGLLLAAGNVVGSLIGVKLAVKVGDAFVRWLILVAALIAAVKLFGLLDYILSGIK